MKRTMTWPPQVQGGRASMTPDPDSDPLDPNVALRQVIRLAILDGTSSNPWNSGIGTPDATFKSNDGTTKARLRTRIRAVFKRLERTHRAKLASLSFPRDPTQPSVLNVEIAYINLETGGRDRMEITNG